MAEFETTWPGMGVKNTSKTRKLRSSYIQRKATASICKLKTFPTYSYSRASAPRSESNSGGKSIWAGGSQAGSLGGNMQSRARIGNGPRPIVFRDCLSWKDGAGIDGFFHRQAVKDAKAGEGEE